MLAETFLLLSVSLAAVMDLPRISGEIKIDGVLDDAAWRLAVRVDLNYETEPGENIEALVQTVVYLMEDGEYIYVAFDASDPRPEEIRAFLRDRDTAWADDFVGVSFDTYNDERRAFRFFANPLGVQMDVIFDDVNDFNDVSWDAIWESAGLINDTGFIVEMKIPLDQLRFQNIDGDQTWNYTLVRVYPRDRRHRLSNNPRERGRNCGICQFSKLRGFKGLKPSRNIEIVPTLTVSRSDRTDDPGIVPIASAGTDAEAGVSIRWGITPDITANFAINPDFSQVETDAAQLDVNNRFALFFPEKRPFFLEGSDYFRTPLQAVFTRTVADPEFGVKITGKRGDHTFGLFAAQDEVTNLLFPGPLESSTTSLEQSNTAIVGRYNRGFPGASSVGGLVTFRDGNGYRNLVAGLDSKWRINDRNAVRIQVLHSETEYPNSVAVEFEQPLGRFAGDAVFIDYNFNTRDWFLSLRHSQSDSNFRADSGFIARVGDKTESINGGHIWHGGTADWWTSVYLWSDYEISNFESGQLLGENASLSLGVGGAMQSWTEFNFRVGKESADGVVFDYKQLRLFGEFSPRAGVTLALFVKVGEQIDFSNARVGNQRLFRPRIDWNISRHLLLRLRLVMVKLETKDGREIFDANLADMRMTWQFNLRSFLRLSIQRQDVDRNQSVYADAVDAQSIQVGRQLLYSYKLNPQTVFFLGYSDNHVDDDALDGLTTSDRSLFMKIGYAWSL